MRRTYGCPPDSPSIQTRTLVPAADARKKAWIIRLDWTFGTNVSLTTDAGATVAVSLRLPCPECGFSRSIAIVPRRLTARRVRLQPPARGDAGTPGAAVCSQPLGFGDRPAGPERRMESS